MRNLKSNFSKLIWQSITKNILFWHFFWRIENEDMEVLQNKKVVS
jgi:hypothetical protein